MCVHNRMVNARARSGTRTISVSWACSFLQSACLNLFLVSFILIFKTFLIFACCHFEAVQFLPRSRACVLSSKSVFKELSSFQVKPWNGWKFWVLLMGPHLHIMPSYSSWKYNYIYHSLVLFFLLFGKASVYYIFYHVLIAVPHPCWNQDNVWYIQCYVEVNDASQSVVCESCFRLSSSS